MRRIIILFMGIALSLLTTACNTMEGLGRDVKRGGEKLERSAGKNTRKTPTENINKTSS